MLESIAGLTPDITGALIVIAFLSGIGITTVGPGGIFLTIALYAITPLSSDVIAGTVQIAFIATGLIGTVAYVRSGELSQQNTVWTVLFCGGSIGGAVFGSWLHAFVTRSLFGVLLGGLAGTTGALIIYRERRPLPAIEFLNTDSPTSKFAYVILGVGLGTCSGLLGVGGPVIAVPALVLLGVPMLSAVAVAQVQSIFIAMAAASGYLVQGSVSITLGVTVGVPLVAGVLLGWKIAHRVDPSTLKVALGCTLVLTAPYLVF